MRKNRLERWIDNHQLLTVSLGNVIGPIVIWYLITIERTKITNTVMETSFAAKLVGSFIAEFIMIFLLWVLIMNIREERKKDHK